MPGGAKATKPATAKTAKRKASQPIAESSAIDLSTMQPTLTLDADGTSEHLDLYFVSLEDQQAKGAKKGTKKARSNDPYYEYRTFIVGIKKTGEAQAFSFGTKHEVLAPSGQMAEFLYKKSNEKNKKLHYSLIKQSSVHNMFKLLGAIDKGEGEEEEDGLNLSADYFPQDQTIQVIIKGVTIDATLYDFDQINIGDGHDYDDDEQHRIAHPTISVELSKPTTKVLDKNQSRVTWKVSSKDESLDEEIGTIVILEKKGKGKKAVAYKYERYAPFFEPDASEYGSDDAASDSDSAESFIVDEDEESSDSDEEEAGQSGHETEEEAAKPKKKAGTASAKKKPVTPTTRKEKQPAARKSKEPEADDKTAATDSAKSAKVITTLLDMMNSMKNAFNELIRKQNDISSNQYDLLKSQESLHNTVKEFKEKPEEMAEKAVKKIEDTISNAVDNAIARIKVIGEEGKVEEKADGKVEKTKKKPENKRKRVQEQQKDSGKPAKKAKRTPTKRDVSDDEGSDEDYRPSGDDDYKSGTDESGSEYNPDNELAPHKQKTTNKAKATNKAKTERSKTTSSSGKPLNDPFESSDED